MASYPPRKRKDGTTYFLAQITRRAKGFQESKSFDTKAAAMMWATKREKEIDAAIAEGRDLTPRKVATITVGDAIDRYIVRPEQSPCH